MNCSCEKSRCQKNVHGASRDQGKNIFDKDPAQRFVAMRGVSSVAMRHQFPGSEMAGDHVSWISMA